MRVRDVGPLVVSADGIEQPVRGSKAAALLALLAVHVNHRVTVESLMDAAWGDKITAGSASTLESHVWRLRALLEPGRSAGESPTVLINDAGGYRLIGTVHTIDSLAFERLAGDVRDLASGGRPSAALARAEEALALWRGRPYGRFADADFARPAVARLDEMHQQIRERRIDALVDVGEIDTALVDLELLIADDPYRESLWVSRMLALYRSGRVEESLQTFQRVRRLLIDEIGNEPGLQLRELHRKILDADPELLPRESLSLSPQRPVEVHLPMFLSSTVGRDDDVARLASLIASTRVVSIVGTAGCGKTRLAVEVARSAAGEFPDGIWFIDLAVISDPDLVVDAVASVIGFASAATGSAYDQLLDYLRDRRMLLVLDNCEHVVPAVARIVEATLGAATTAAPASCTFLVTSREPLDIDGETVWTLGPLSLLPDTQARAPAVELFLQRLQSAAPQTVIDDAVVRLAISVSVAVDGVPLALELAAARARTYTLDDIAAQVAADPSTLRRIGRGPADHRSTVRSAIDWSYRMLSPAEQLAHRRLSVLSGSFTVAMADAVLADADTGDVLAQLVHRSMLSSSGPGRTGGATTFHQLATVRAHAQHALTQAGETADVAARRDRWCAAILDDRPPLGSSGEAAWYRMVDDGYPTIRATLAQMLIETPDPAGARLPARLASYWYYRANMVEAGRWYRLAHDAATDPVDALLASLSLATALTLQGRSDMGRPYVEQALPRIPSVSAERRVEVGGLLVGAATAAWARDEFELLTRLHASLSDVVESTGDDQLGVLCDAVGTVAVAASGDLASAAVNGHDVYHRAVAMDNHMAAWIAAGPPMVEALYAAKPSEGVPWVLRIMSGHLRVASRAGGMFIETRANFATQSGDYRRAASMYAAARTHTRRAAMVWPRRRLTQELLDVTREHLSANDFESAWQDGEQLTLQDVVDAG